MKTAPVSSTPMPDLPADVQSHLNARLADVPPGETLIDTLSSEAFAAPDLGNIAAGQTKS